MIKIIEQAQVILSIKEPKDKKIINQEKNHLSQVERKGKIDDYYLISQKKFCVNDSINKYFNLRR